METDDSPPADPQGSAPLMVLNLYVAGSGTKSMSAVGNIRHICEHYLKGHYQLEVLDLYRQPERAKVDNIVALPTLVKLLPLPEQRIIGDLADTKLVCALLGVEGLIRQLATTPASPLHHTLQP